jgi:hypothetical protein
MCKCLTATFILLAFVANVLAEDKDLVRIEFDKSKTVHDEAIEKANKDFIAGFDSKIQEVAATGSLDGVKAIQAEKKQYEVDGKMPTSAAMKKLLIGYQTGIDNARKRMTAAYETAVSQYTKALQIDKAESINSEFEAFKKSSAVNANGKAANVDDAKTTERVAQIRIPATSAEFKGHHYKVIDEKCTWHVAKGKCEKLGGHLVCITDRDEGTFVNQLLSKAHLERAWIGATDEEEEGKWQWVNGEPFRYNEWPPGQPDNGNGGEHHAEVWSENRGWNDFLEGVRQPYICEWDK